MIETRTPRQHAHSRAALLLASSLFLGACVDQYRVAERVDRIIPVEAVVDFYAPHFSGGCFVLTMRTAPDASHSLGDEWRPTPLPKERVRDGDGLWAYVFHCLTDRIDRNLRYSLQRQALRDGNFYYSNSGFDLVLVPEESLLIMVQWR